MMPPRSGGGGTTGAWEDGNGNHGDTESTEKATENGRENGRDGGKGGTHPTPHTRAAEGRGLPSAGRSGTADSGGAMPPGCTHVATCEVSTMRLLRHALPLVLAVCLLPLAAQAQSLTLADNGRTDFRIVIARDASPSVKWAAGELQKWLKEISGATLPLATDDTPVSAHEIVLGANAHLASLGVQAPLQELGTEGYLLRTSGPHLLLIGGPVRGAVYSVFGLLEDHLGCRWFTPEVNRIPRQSKLLIGPLDERKIPALEYREPFVKDCFDGDWCARNRQNSSAARLEAQHGGKIQYYGFVHTFNDLVPPAKYYAEHPEYFSLINGKRMNGYYQLCLTNPDVVRIATEEIRRRMRAHPEAFVFSVSQNDTGGACQCEKCQAVVAREGSESGPLIEFVNKIADAVKDEFPDKVIDTLAYQYTRKAPKTVRPRPNVIVRLCSIECCFSHPLRTCDSPANASFRKDIADWAKVCDRLWVWDYTTDFANFLVPFPNRHVLRDNIRFFIENHVTGIFEEDTYTTLCGEFNSLDGYMQAKFLWNPDYDPEVAMNEFLAAVYGKAAGPIRQYLDLLRDKVVKENIHLRIWEGPNAAHLTDELLEAGDRLWDQAEAAVADDPATLGRVQVARLSLDWELLERTRRATTGPYAFRAGKYQADVEPRYARRVERFFSTAEKNGLTALREGGSPPATLKQRIRAKAGSFDVVTLSDAALAVGIVPGIGGRVLIIQPAGAANLCYTGVPEDPGYPAIGGYAESWQGAPQGPGWSDEFTASAPEETDDCKALEMTCDLREGVKLARTVMLPKGRGYFEVLSTVTNSCKEDQPGDLRGSFGLNLGDTDQVTAVLPAMGSQGVISLSLSAGEAEKQLSFTGAQIARGIKLANHTAGRGIEVIPSAPAIERVWLRVDARRDVITFEVKTKAPLKPGENTWLRQRVRPLRDLAAVPRAPHTGATTHASLRVVAQDDLIGVGRYGEWGWIEEAAGAEDGFAIRFNNNHIEWCCQWRYSPSQFEPGVKYDVFARIKVDKIGNTGSAFWAGVYDAEHGVGLGSIQPPMTQIADSEWHLYKLGTVTPAEGHYVWMGPQNNAASQRGLWLDYFELRAVK